MVIRALLYCLLFSFNAAAQVPVSKEPRHHPVLANDKVRALNVLLPAGDTTMYHLHATPSVFIMFTTTTIGNQVFGGQPSQGTSTAGNIYFEDLSLPHTRIHRVWNEDTATFHVMDIELLSAGAGFSSKPLTLPYTSLLINNPWVRTYKVQLAASQVITVKQQHSYYLLVAITGGLAHTVQNGTEKIIALKAGDVTWIKPLEYFSLTNTGNSPQDFALLEVN